MIAKKTSTAKPAKASRPADKSASRNPGVSARCPVENSAGRPVGVSAGRVPSDETKKIPKRRFYVFSSSEGTTDVKGRKIEEAEWLQNFREDVHFRFAGLQNKIKILDRKTTLT